jgi:amidase
LLPDVAETTGNYAELLAAERCDMPRDVYQRWQDSSKSFAPKSLQAHLARGLALTHGDWLLATRARVSLRERWNALFNEFDVLLCPVAPRTAFPHDHSVPKEQRKIDVDGKPIAYFDQIAWSGIATLNGLPATAAPLERSEGGLPMGVQIIGPLLEDRTPIKFAGLNRAGIRWFRAASETRVTQINSSGLGAFTKSTDRR